MNTDISIDGERLSINDKQLEFFIFLTERGFFREIEEGVFASIILRQANRLNSIYDSSIAPVSQSVLKSEASLLDSIPSQYFKSSFGKGSRFDSIMLFYITRIYFPFLYVGQPSELANGGPSEARRKCKQRGRGKCVPPKSRLIYEFSEEASKPTAGSKEFKELDRNEPTPKKKVVKKKINTPKITKQVHFEIDRELETITEKWIEWAKSKAPWLAHKFTTERFYVALEKVKENVTSNGQLLGNTGLLEILYFVRNDSFWKDQVVSPNQLLKDSRNGVRKVDNILLAIKKKIDKTQPLKGVNLEECPF